MRVTFCAYRPWALAVIEEIKNLCDIEIVDIVKDEDTYKEKVLAYGEGTVDCIVLIGWSWIIKDETLKKFLCVGIHPSDLPYYRGGSPIQHQIIAGLEKTKISLMTISQEGVDVGDIWGKEDWDLSGNTMDNLFCKLTQSSVRLLKHFFENYDKISPLPQNLREGSYYKRRKPEESKVTWEQLSNMDLKDVYNLIRALTDPYPNIYIEDEKGHKLFFKEVGYQ